MHKIRSNPSLLLILAATFLICNFPCDLQAAHGISIDGKVKYPAGFMQFDYTSEKASKGGKLLLHGLGSFDKMNPYTLKGTPPDGLEMLVFETLAVPSLDEPFAEYGLIAKDIELAADGLSVTFTVDARARFANAKPVTVDDIAFSMATMKSSAAHPFYQAYFNDISGSEIINKEKIRFNFSQKNRELHMIAAQLPIFSKDYYSEHPFDTQSMDPPLGSGPYIVSDINPGKSMTYKRNPDYWAADLAVRRNMFNFESITYKYFKDQIVSVEAFKAHEFDFMYINIAKQWARDLTGPKFNKGDIIKKTLDHSNNQGMQGFVFNIRKPIFQDRQTRKALGMAFDFEWANKTLFFNQYTRSSSFFSNSKLAATSLPKGLELDYLLPHREKLPGEVFSAPLTPPSTLPPSSVRKNLREAQALLKNSGWKMKDGVLHDKKDQPLQFEILLVSPSFERVMAPYVKNLKKLGVKASYRTIDPALFTRRLQDFDFDMVVNVFGQSQSPGNEQRNYWHSSSATSKGSRNLIGLADPVVDDLTDKIIYATTQDELTAACKALDRVLWHGYYVVPNWYLARHRVAYWNRFEKPATLPNFYSPMQALMTWWLKN